jgi:hypothetical protein
MSKDFVVNFVIKMCTRKREAGVLEWWDEHPSVVLVVVLVVVLGPHGTKVHRRFKLN